MGKQNTQLYKAERKYELWENKILSCIKLKGLKDLKFFWQWLHSKKESHDFQKFKQSLKNFEETEKIRINKRDEVPKNATMKTENNFGSNSKNKGIMFLFLWYPRE